MGFQTRIEFKKNGGSLPCKSWKDRRVLMLIFKEAQKENLSLQLSRKM